MPPSLFFCCSGRFGLVWQALHFGGLNEAKKEKYENNFHVLCRFKKNLYFFNLNKDSFFMKFLTFALFNETSEICQIFVHKRLI